MAQPDEHVLNVSQLQFYKRHFGALILTLLVSLIVIALLVGAFVVVKTQDVRREYFAVDTETGRLTPIVALTQPYVSTAALLTWVVECVTSANNYDFVHFRDQFQRNRACFTSAGWDQFMAAVDRSKTLETVKTQRLVASAAANSAPVIVNEGIRRGAYTWQIEVPITVNYQGGQAGRAVFTQRLLVTVLISRIPTYESKHGIGIAQYIAQEK